MRSLLLPLPARFHRTDGKRRNSPPRFGLKPSGLPAVFYLAAALLLSSCASAFVSQPPGTFASLGTASWYGDEFHGRTTSSGVRYDMYGMTAASKTLPLGCRIRVTRLDNGKSVVVTVNDRGPFVGERILDLSYEAARRLEMLAAGLATVEIEILEVPAGTSVQAVAEAERAFASRPGAAAGAAYAPTSAYWLSLGTFSIEDNALWLQKKLAREISSLGVRSLKRGKAVIYQVRAGPYRTGEESEKARLLLADLGFKSSLLRE